MLGGCWDDLDCFYYLQITQRKPTNRVHKRAKSYRHDPSFVKSLFLLRENSVEPLFIEPQHIIGTIPWDSMPVSSTAAGGGLPIDRIYRKTIQIESMMILVMNLISRLEKTKMAPLVIVEFCAGSGFVCIPMAVLHPQARFIMIDRKCKSIEIAKERVIAAKLDNVETIEGDISDFKSDFDVGIALHACGAASDLSLQICVKNRAAFVICPCCIGKVVLDRRVALSKKIKTILDENSYCRLIKSADFGHSTEELACHSHENSLYRRQSKRFVEEDRRLYAEEHGYHAYITSMWPPGASPKDDIIVGWSLW